MSAPAIGIDLGTTYSCVGVFQNGKIEIIANDQGNRTTPSVVAFTDCERLVGEVAKSQATRNPENTVFDAKRMIGRKFDDEELKQDLEHWPFKVCDYMGELKVSVKYKGKRKLVTPVEISAMILTKMKKTAEAYLSKTVTDAVITVPAYFNNSQRQATKDAGTIAGLNVMRIINEPTAAALAYGLDKKLDCEQNVLIFDLGGGTFDVSVLAVADNVFEVLSTAGNTHLGGEDFDHRLVKHFSSEFKRKHGKDISRSSLALRRLKTACEEAKRTLSSSSVAYVEIDSLYEDIDFSSKISRARFDDLCADQFRSTLHTLQRALEDAKLKKSSIDEVVLVGGSTRIPKIRKLLEDFFDGIKLNFRINADEAVAYGAAVQAAALSGISTPGVDDHLLLDVLPFSLGVRVGDEGKFGRIIERNSRVPIRREQEFRLGHDYQTAADILIYEGEYPLASDNHLLGEFQLGGLPAARIGEVEIVITFDVDADGLLNVSARDKKTGRSEGITISCLNFLGQDELKRMQEDAEKMEVEATEEEERRKREEEYWRSCEKEDNDEGRKSSRDKCSSNIAGCREGNGDERHEDKVEQTTKMETEGSRDKGRKDSGSSLSDKAEANEIQESSVTALQVPETGKGKEHWDTSDNDDMDDAAETNACQKESSGITRVNHPDEVGKPQQEDSPIVNQMSDDVLFVVEALLNEEPRTSITERLEIYQRSLDILSKVTTTSKDAHVRSRCSDLHARLREKYGDAAASFKDVTTIPGREPSSLNDRVLDYLREILQAVVKAADGISQADNLKVNGMVVDLMNWMDANEYAGEYELLKRIKELQSVCESIDGLQTPNDDYTGPEKTKPKNLVNGEGSDEGEMTNGEDERDTYPLRDRVQGYVCEVIQAVVDTGDAMSDSERGKLNNMCTEILMSIENDQNVQDGELLRKVMELRTTGKGINGLQMPSDDLFNGLERTGENYVEETGNVKDGELRDSEDEGRNQSHGNLPPLEEVF